MIFQFTAVIYERFTFLFNTLMFFCMCTHRNHVFDSATTPPRKNHAWHAAVADDSQLWDFHGNVKRPNDAFSSETKNNRLWSKPENEMTGYQSLF